LLGPEIGEPLGHHLRGHEILFCLKYKYSKNEYRKKIFNKENTEGREERTDFVEKTHEEPIGVVESDPLLHLG
jgi:hypothetical protein